MSPPAFLLRRAVIALLAVPLVLVSVSGVLAWQTDVTAHTSEQVMDALHRERLELSALLNRLVDMETGHRGYLLTGDAAFLAPYEEAAPQAAAHLERLRATAGSASYFEQLRALVDAKVMLMRDSIAQMRAGNREGGMAIVVSGEGKRRMDAVRAVANEWTAAAERALAVQRVRLDRDLDRSRWATLGAIVVQVALCGFAAWALWRWSRLHGLVTVCAWSRTIKYEGGWITFEEYLEREFGIRTSHGMSPAQVEKFNADLQRLRNGGSG